MPAYKAFWAALSIFNRSKQWQALHPLDTKCAQCSFVGTGLSQAQFRLQAAPQLRCAIIMMLPTRLPPEVSDCFWLSMQESGRGWLELLTLGLHYGWYLGLCFSWLPPAKALLFVLLSQMFAGFLLSIVFVQVRTHSQNILTVLLACLLFTVSGQYRNHRRAAHWQARAFQLTMVSAATAAALAAGTWRRSSSPGGSGAAMLLDVETTHQGPTSPG